MAESERKPPAFFCPSCGQKHRADLSPLAKRPGAFVRATCRRCSKELRVHMEEGRPVADLVTEASGADPTGGPYETEAPSDEKPFGAGARVGRYTVKGIAQRGQTSTVYRAHDPTTKRAVALKVLRADAPESARAGFVRQVEVQANIRHPNIMPVYDRGTLDDGRPYFTMELLHRPLTLADLLERRTAGQLTKDRALAPLMEFDALVERILLPVADGIYVANVENGVVHGDLRPENILIDGRSLRPYVMDFGRSREPEDTGARTQAALTPFLAPEQARGWVYARTDVWGLGALLHLMLDGEPPLRGAGEVLRQHAIAGRYAPLDAQAEPGLVAVTRKAMALEPEARYVNARQMAADLKAWRKGGRVRAVEEFGGPGASAQEARAALRQHLRTAAFVLGGLVLGIAIGSRIRIGGEDPSAVRTSAVQAEVNGLDSALTRLQPAAVELGAEEGHLVWLHLEEQATRMADRLAKAKASAARSSVEKRLAYVRERFAPARVDIEAPAGLTIQARSRASGRGFELTPGEAVLPPGAYEVKAGGATFRARIPLSVRQGGASVDTGSARASWFVPMDPTGLPATCRLVVGCREIDLGGLPFSAAKPPVSVDTFAMALRPVTNAEYEEFLASLPDAERNARVPSSGFEEASGAWRAVSRSAKRPVTGLRPDDAHAFCAWRTTVLGRTVRLPTEEEWLYASGLTTERCATGDLALWPTDNAYGLEGLMSAPREMTEAEGGEVIVRGASDAETSSDTLCSAAVGLAGGERDEGIGFRWVMELGAAD